MTADEIRLQLAEAVRGDKRAAAVLKKIAEGKADFTDTMTYSLISGRLTGEQLSDVILEFSEGREELAEALLRDRCEDINAKCAAVQTTLDEKQGVHLAPRKAAFPKERAATFAHSLTDPTVSDETIKRRARSVSENITVTFHDDFIEENVKFRDRLGLKCYVERTTVGDCCPWCSGIAGRYEMRNQPPDFFGRHDNCDCIIVYDGQVLRGQRGENGRRGRRWVEDKPKVEYTPPKRFSRKEAEKLQAGKMPKRLTGGENGGIMYSDSDSEYKPVSPEAYSRITPLDVFGDQRDHLIVEAMRDVLNKVDGKEPGTEWLALYDYQTMSFIDGVLSEIGAGEVEPLDHNEAYISIHNHASLETFSFQDIYKFQEFKKCKAIFVVGNNGNCYALAKGKEYDDTGLFMKIIKRVKGFEPYTDDTEERFIEECKKYGVKYYERRY